MTTMLAHRAVSTLGKVSSALSILLTALSASAAIPPAEKILPDDTLVLVSVPDSAKMREIYKKSPQIQFWNDAAMKPFREKFITKFKEELVQPLERDLSIQFKD